MAIPKLIHQTWSTLDIPFDTYRREWVTSWSRHHPSWRYKLWTDADLGALVQRHCPHLGVFFERAPGVVKADFGRYLVLYVEGGMYVDLDYECYKPLDPLMFSVKAILSWNSPRRDCLNNAWLAGENGYELFRTLYEEAARRWMAGSGSVEWATGPKLLTDVVSRVCRGAERTAKIMIYPSFVLCPIDWGSGHAIAQRSIDETNLAAYREEAIRRGAYAATYWAHNWRETKEPTDDLDAYAEIFTDLYESNRWRGGRCGDGSTAEATRQYVAFLQAFLLERRIGSVLDIGCGDWSFSSGIDWLGASYVGLDVNARLIATLAHTRARPGVDFVTGNALDTELPAVDLVLCKDVLQHMPNEHARRLLARIKQSCRYALITNDGFEDPSRNRDIAIGGFRVFDPTHPPFDERGFEPVLGFNGKTVFLYSRSCR